jgi:hypothetical protein
MITIDYKPLFDYVDLLNNGTPFSFSRYWDGEIECMVGRMGLGYNCDKCHYTEGLKKALLKTIENNYDYFHAVNQPKNNQNTKGLQAQFEQLLLSMESKIKWYDFMVFQYAVETGNFFPMIDALRKKKVLFLGGGHLAKIRELLPDAEFIETPSTDAFDKLSEIESQVKKRMVNDLVVILCLGMASNVFIDDMFPAYGKIITMIDMGSAWDALLGLKSRRWIRKIEPQIMRKNYGQS